MVDGVNESLRDPVLELHIIRHELGQEGAVVAYAVEMGACAGVVRFGKLCQRDDEPFVGLEEVLGCHFGRLPQASRNETQDTLGEALVLIHKDGEIVLLQAEEGCIGQRPERSRPRIVRYESHFSENIPRPNARQFASADASSLEDGHLTLGNDIEAVAMIPFLEEGRTRPAIHLVESFGYQGDIFRPRPAKRSLRPNCTAISIVPVLHLNLDEDSTLVY